MFSLSLKLHLLKLHFSKYSRGGPSTGDPDLNHTVVAILIGNCVLISESLGFIIRITLLFVSSTVCCRPVPYEVTSAATELAGTGRAVSGTEFQVRFSPPFSCSGKGRGDGGGENV